MGIVIPYHMIIISHLSDQNLMKCYINTNTVIVAYSASYTIIVCRVEIYFYVILPYINGMESSS
jgi:hypothetical protein